MGTIRNCIFAARHDRDIGAFVRSTGEFDLHSIDYPSCRKNLDFAQIFWPISGAGIFHWQGKKFRVTKNHVWYYPPRSDHYFHPDGKSFHYHWLTLQGRDTAAIFHTLAIRPGLSPAGPCPVVLFQKLAAEITGGKKSDSLQALATAFQILSLASAYDNTQKHQKDYLDNVKAVIEDDFGNALLSVEQLAQNFHVHRVTLSRAFSARYHISISRYIALCRIRAAQDLLHNTDLPASEIARQCGFSSPGYFSKVISKATGASPGKLRNN
ncbi:MAG: AraC family transcriptional regulator [Victivallaceae bacterium]|nr:AraC family transcriptional regulator [Victivallaceae bacterium]